MSRPVLEGLVGIALLSAMDAIIKALVAGLPVVEVAFLRYAVGSLVMLGAFAVVRPGWPRADTIRANAGRAVLVVVTATAFFYGLGELPLAEALILSFVSPLFTTLLAVLVLHEKLDPRILAAIGAGFAGVVVIVVGGHGLAGGPPLDAAASLPPGRPLWGALAILLSACTYSASNVLLRARAQRDPVLAIVLIQNLMPAAILAGPTAFVWTSPAAGEIRLLLCAGLLGVAGHLLLARAYAGAEAMRLAPLDYTALLWAVVFGFLAFAEVPSLWAVLGAALILSGALAGSRRRG